MITHNEAEVLISARQDAPLDPLVERELQAHLATCDDCRAFAIATERLTAGIKAMPSIPVNPRTRRAVMERAAAGRNPLARLFGGFGGGFQAGPVLAAVATLVIIGLIGLMVVDRLVLDDSGSNGETSQLAAVPTEEAVDQFVASPTAEPTETPEPTEEPTAEPEPTETPVPTEEPTTEPEPTDEPTEEPEPTDEPTAEPEPTDEPTEEPEPTATTEPTAALEEDEPVDLTAAGDEDTSLSLERGAPTQASEPTTAPTAEPTEEPTVEPTEEPTVEPTEEPTAEPTVEPTVEPEPTETPAIEPMDGFEVSDDLEEGLGIGSGPEDDAAIEPINGSDAVAIEDIDSEDVLSTAIQPLRAGDDPADPEDADAVIEEEEDPADEDEAPELPEGQRLLDASVGYQSIAGDPSGQLGLTRDGRLEYMQVPDGASVTTSGGFQMRAADDQPGVVLLCGDDFCEPSMEAPEDDGWQGDVPLAVIGDSAYFLRMYGEHTEVYSAITSGTSLIEPEEIGELGPTSPPSEVYENNGIMFAWLPHGEWLEISDGTAQIFPGGYSNPTNLRFAPIAQNGPLLGYFSNGTLVIAPVTAPDSAIFTMPTDGIDFDIAPMGDRVAVIQDDNIVIYDIDGNVLSVYEGQGEVQPRSLIWLRGGLVYIDSNTGALYEMPETAP